MPQQWTDAANFYQNIMGGGGVGASPYWNTAGNTFTQMAQGGMPVDVSGLYGAMLPKTLRTLNDFQKQAAEGAGVGGIRYSTPLAHQLTEFSGRLAENMGLSQVQAQISAEEAARQRMLSGAGGLGQLGQMETNLGLSNLANQMSAAGGLAGVGGAMFNAPMQVANQMFGMGGGMMDMQNQQINQMMNDPYLAMALQMAGQNNQYAPQQYTPGWGTQLMNVGGALAPYAFGGGGGGQQGGYPQGPNPYQNPSQNIWG